MILVTAVIGLASAELFGVLRRVGYEPVTLAGIVGCVGLALGAYNNGTAAIPAVLFLTTAVCLLWYLVGAANEAPVMNVGVTLLGVLWVGLFGSFAALMLALPPTGGLEDPGTGILLAAILGTVGYDVGGLFIGKNAGRQPLSDREPEQDRRGPHRRLRGRRRRGGGRVGARLRSHRHLLRGAPRRPRRRRRRPRSATSASR